MHGHTYVPSVSMEFHWSLPFLYIKETTIVFNGSSNWQATRTNKDRQQEQPEQERAAHHHTRQRVNLHAPGHGKRCWKKQGQPAKLITMWSLSGLRLPGVAPALGRARPDERTRSPSLPGFPPPVTLPACVRDRGQRHRNSKPERLPFGVASTSSRHRNPQTQRPLPPLPFPTAPCTVSSSQERRGQTQHGNRMNSAAYDTEVGE